MKESTDPPVVLRTYNLEGSGGGGEGGVGIYFGQDATFGLSWETTVGPSTAGNSRFLCDAGGPLRAR